MACRIDPVENVVVPFEVLQRDACGDDVEKFVEGAIVSVVVEELLFGGLNRMASVVRERKGAAYLSSPLIDHAEFELLDFEFLVESFDVLLSFVVRAVVEMIDLQVGIELLGEPDVVARVDFVLDEIDRFRALLRSNDDEQFVLVRLDGHDDRIEVGIDPVEIIVKLKHNGCLLSSRARIVLYLVIEMGRVDRRHIVRGNTAISRGDFRLNDPLRWLTVATLGPVMIVRRDQNVGR